VIIATDLNEAQEQKLLDVFKEHKEAIGWSIGDIKGISPTMVMHKIHLEENAKPSREPQRRLNPTMQEVVRAEVIKLLDAGIIYQISDNKWLSPIHVVPKKAGITMIKNKDNELVPTRVQSGWRVSIDYRKLNSATTKATFLYLSLIRCWRDWLAMLTTVSLMATLVTIKFRWTPKIRRRPLHLSFRYVCLSPYAFRVVTCYFSVVHDQHFLRYG
jgi:hypothetical protein